LKKEIQDRLKASLENSDLGELARMLEGFDPAAKLQELKNLESLAYAKELESSLGQKTAQWNSALKAMPQDQEFNELQEKVRSVKIGGSIGETKDAISKLSQLLKEAESKMSAVSQSAAQLQSDVANTESAIKKLDDVALKDKQAQEKSLNLPDVSPKNLSQQVFGQAFAQQIRRVEEGKALLAQHLPARSSAEKPKDPPRFKGRNFSYPAPAGARSAYPSFWLQRMTITSMAADGPYAGQISGQIVDLASDQKLLGRPATLNVNGDFPTQQIRGVALQGLFEPDRASAKFTVASFPVGSKMFMDTPGARLGITKAVGHLSAQGAVNKGIMKWGVRNEFRNAAYDFSAPSPLLKNVFQKALQNLQTLWIDAEASGTAENLDWAISSNLGDALQQAITGILGEKLALAKQKISKMVDEKLLEPKRKLLGQFEENKKRVTSQIDQKKAKADQTRQLALNKIEEAKQKAASAAAPAQKALGGAKKKLGF
jgi:uncharacterized protein (TIGR03545 family)